MGRYYTHEKDNKVIGYMIYSVEDITMVFFYKFGGYYDGENYLTKTRGTTKYL